MITSKDIRNKRFEKGAFGYNLEEVDAFLSQLEAELDEMERERAEANNKIQILADRVREYMRDEEALKDALLMAQKQGKQVVREANEKAESIINEAKEKAAEIEEETERQHQLEMEKNRQEIEAEHQYLIDTKRRVTEFKKSMFEMYKEHLTAISAMPDFEAEIQEKETAEEIAAVIASVTDGEETEQDRESEAEEVFF